MGPHNAAAANAVASPGGHGLNAARREANVREIGNGRQECARRRSAAASAEPILGRQRQARSAGEVVERHGHREERIVWPEAYRSIPFVWADLGLVLAAAAAAAHENEVAQQQAFVVAQA